jgi:hypothetical protein
MLIAIFCDLQIRCVFDYSNKGVHSHLVLGTLVLSPLTRYYLVI